MQYIKIAISGPGSDRYEKKVYRIFRLADFNKNERECNL